MTGLLRQLDATGDVRCELREIAAGATTVPAGAPTTAPSQMIESQHLELIAGRTSDGRMYPAQVIADGEVHTADAEREMWSGRLLLKMTPATRPTTAAGD